jgi:hypothetical protein
MKECPLCKETFADDLKFCDLDGTRLKRVVDASGASGPGRVWSLLGVGLLLGAIIISAASIIFLPKAQVSPPVTGTQSSAPPPVQARTAEPATNSATNQQISLDVAGPDLKKKDKLQSLSNQNSNSSALNPKTASLSSEDEQSKLPAKTDAPAVAPVQRKETPSEASPLPKPTSETRKSEAISQEPTPKPAQTNTDVKKEQKRAPAKMAEKESNSNKKGGSFFRVFKKIFGKD